MKRILQILLIATLLLLLTIGAAITTLWLKPSLVLNRTTLAMIAEHARARGWADVQWADAQVIREKTGRLEKRLRLAFGGLCAHRDLETGTATVCARSLEVAAIAGIQLPFKPYLRELGPVRLEAGRWTLPQAPKKGRALPPLKGTASVRTEGQEVRLQIAQRRKRIEARIHVPTTEALLAGQLRFDLKELKQTLVPEIPPFKIGRCFAERKDENWQATCNLRWPGMAQVESRLATDERGGARAQAEVRVSRFEALVAHLATTPWSVPSPFNILKGEITVKAEAPRLQNNPIVQAKLETRLRSARQTLDLAGQAKLALEEKKKPRLEATVELSDIELVLPRMNLAAPPKVFPDSRFLSKPRGPMPLNYSVRIHTPAAGPPVRLLSNLAKAPIPLSVDVTVIDSAAPQGRLSLARFPLELFRRAAEVEGFTLSLARPLEESRIQGAATVNYTDYRVSVRVLATIGKPVVQLTSEPPLPENQLWAALLFGRPLEELDTGGVQSVGDAQAALADGAMSLLSLYTLAATPVESVRYDPGTKALVARVRLAEGTSLEVGANQAGVAQVGLRRRLGGPWILSTEWQSGTLSTLLEWSRRY